MKFNPFSLLRSDEADVIAELRAEIQAMQHMDQYASSVTGLGNPQEDKAFNGVSYSAPPRLDWGTLDDLYRSNGVGKRIADHPANEAAREGIGFNADRKIADKLHCLIEERGLISSANRADRYSEAFRGGVVVLDVDDGRAVDEPVDKRRIRDVFVRFVVDARRAYPESYVDPWTPVQQYNITTSNVTLYHSDRLLVFDGIDSGDDNRMSNWGWGESIYDVINYSLANYCSDYTLGSTLLKDQSVMLFKQEGFNAKVKKKGAKHALKMARARRRMASAVNAILMDKEDEFEYVNRNITGISEIIKLAKEFLCAQVGIPHSELFAESPGASLGEGGTYQSRSFYNMVRRRQRDRIAPNLRKFINYLCLAHGLPQDVPFYFKSLWQMTPKEKSEVYSKTAEGDFKYFQMGVLDEDNIQSRFSADGFNQDIVVERGEDLDDASDSTSEDEASTEEA